MTLPYRVLGRTADGDGLLVAPRVGAPDDPDAFAPVSMATPDGDGEAVGTIDGVDLYTGYAVEAAFDADDPPEGPADRPTPTSVVVERETLLTVAADVSGLYEAATDAYRTAQAAGDGIATRVTRGTDGDPNGALYAFADPPGGRLVEEFRSGRRPIEPLIRRADEGRTGDGPMEVFVLESASDPFVAVHVVFEREGLLANTIRETYDLTRPDAVGGLAGRIAGAEEDANDEEAESFDLLDADLPTRE